MLSKAGFAMAVIALSVTPAWAYDLHHFQTECEPDLTFTLVLTDGRAQTVKTKTTRMMTIGKIKSVGRETSVKCLHYAHVFISKRKIGKWRAGDGTWHKP